MSLHNVPIKVNKKLKIGLDIERRDFDSTIKKEKLFHNSGIDVQFETSIPEPVVFRSLTPTRTPAQTIKGLRPSENYLVQINGTTAGISYIGREFSKRFNLNEGTNAFEVCLVRNMKKGNSVFFSIEKNTESPKTILKANGIEIKETAVTKETFDIIFETNDRFAPTTTYYKIDNGVTQAFSSDINLLNEGYFQIEFWSVDSIGNEEIPHNLATLIINRTPPPRPLIDIDNLPAKTNKNDILIQGTKSSNAVQIVVNGEEAIIDNTVDWHILVPLLIEGANVITAVAYDIAGNASGAAVVVIIRDQTPPTKPYLVSPGPLTRDSSVLLIGGQSAETIYMLLDGLPGFIEITSQVKWAAEVSLEEGFNIFEIQSVDDVGNISEPLIVTIEKISIPPEPPTINPVMSPTNIDSQLLTGTYGPGTELILINNNPNFAIINNGTWKAIYTSLNEGLNVIEVQAEDIVGNISSPITVEIVLDTIPPDPPTFDILPFFTNKQTLLVSGNKTKNSIEVLFNGSSAGVSYPNSTRWSIPIVLLAGENIFVIKAKDELGNVSKSSATAVTLKTNPPTFSINSYPSEIILENIQITGFREADSFIEINGIDENINYPDSLAGVTWTAELNLNPGVNVFILQAIDFAGNKSIAKKIYINRLIPVNITEFSIDSVYLYGQNNANQVTSDGIALPTITSSDITSFYIYGTKESGTDVVANFGQVLMPKGKEGQTWSMIVPASVLAHSFLNILFTGNLVINPPSITISKILIAQNIFIGTVTLNIGGSVLVTMVQNSSIVLTDYQLKNTPSPFEGISLDQILSISET